MGLLSALAEAGTFECFGLDRRTALWEVRKLVHTRDESLPLLDRETKPAFEALNDFEEVGWDYIRTQHSPRRHPLAPLREQLSAQVCRMLAPLLLCKTVSESVTRAGDLPPAPRHRRRRGVHDTG